LKQETVVLHNLKVGTNGSAETLNLSIQWISKPEPLKGMLMIIFTDLKETTINKLQSIKIKTHRQYPATRAGERVKVRT